MFLKTPVLFSVAFFAMACSLACAQGLPAMNDAEAEILFWKALRNKKLSMDSLVPMGQTLINTGKHKHVLRGRILQGLGYLSSNQVDSASHILFVALGEAEQDRSTRFELGLTHNYLGSVFTQLNNHKRAREEFEAATALFHEINNIEYLAVTLSNIGTAYGAQGDYPKALDYFLQAQKLTSDPSVTADQRANILSNIAFTYSLMNKPREALSYAFQALRIDEAEKNTKRLCQAYNAIGNIYNRNEDFDSALYYYQKTLKTANTSDPAFRPVAFRALQNTSRIYLRQGRMREAIEMIKQVQRGDVNYQVESFYNLLAEYHRNLKEYDSAVFYARKAVVLAKQSNTKETLRNTYGLLHSLFLAQKRIDSAYRYQGLHHTYIDSLFNETNSEKFSNLRIELETLEKEREVEMLKKQAELQDTKARLFAVYVFSGFVIMMLILISVVQFYQNRQRKHQLKNIELQKELEKRSSDLRQQALKMIYINNGLAEIEESLRKIKTDSPTDIQQVLSSIHINRSLEKEWDNFNSYFGHLHTGFFEKLDTDYRQLTIADKRLAGLVRMNLTNKEIAGILNIEDASVKTAKYRLKKKLGLNDEQSLYSFLTSFVPSTTPHQAGEMEEV